ncbi:MAG: hypothetical protein ACJAYR_000851 [Sneathiella sp.]|jgi:hypothetical protein
MGRLRIGYGAVLRPGSQGSPVFGRLVGICKKINQPDYRLMGTKKRGGVV